MSSFSKCTPITSLFHLFQLHFLLFLLINITQCPLACHGCHEQERRALLDFKFSLEDPANRLSSWLDDNRYRNCCDWHGVGCSSDSSHVISINLRNTVLETFYHEYLIDEYLYDVSPPNTALHGKFSSSIFNNISHLEYVDLAFNNFDESKIPFLSSALTKLMHLDLSHSNFSAPVLASLTNLSSLRYLDLSCCLIGTENKFVFTGFCLKLSSIKWLRGSVNLKVLRLRGIDLHEAASSEKNFAESISYLSNLRNLDLSDSNLPSTVFPTDEFSNLTFLRTLDLSWNDFQGSIPESISNLTFLRTLDLSFNDFIGSIPESISNLTFLRKLDLSRNYFRGSIPKSISNLTFLRKLDLSRNYFRGSIPESISNLTFLSNLKFLDLSHNHLTGVIPTCFSKLSFSTFHLSNNKLHGRLPLPPQAFDTYSSLTLFDVSFNKITGEISTDYGKRLSSFNSINLAGNELSSSIPFSICSRDDESYYIDLSNNKFFGVIPTSIGYSRNLISLNLGHNNLTGNVPNELQQLKSLTYLQLNDNILDGTPLSFISKLQGLQVLNLANNHFEGNIPSAVGSAIRLRILSLRSNKFNGSIPQEISHLEELQILDLSENNLTGVIPRKIGNLMMLRSRPNNTYLLASSTIDVQLQMVIKGIMIQFKKLYAYSSGLDLSCNNLEGNIPEEIGLLKGLSTLNLSHNRFSSFIPQSVGSMNGLESLDLSFNKLTGHIPYSLASMSSLERLNLSYNNLSGSIPREPHFDTLSGDGSAYLNNSLLCGFYTNNTCEADQRSEADHEDDKEDPKDKLLLYAIVALGFAVGFWGLFFVLLLKKQKWWFPYWRLIDVVAMGVANCMWKN